MPDVLGARIHTDGASCTAENKERQAAEAEEARRRTAFEAALQEWKHQLVAGILVITDVDTQALTALRPSRLIRDITGFGEEI